MMTNFQMGGLQVFITDTKDLTIMSIDSSGHTTHIEVHTRCKSLMVIKAGSGMVIGREIITRITSPSMIEATITPATTKKTMTTRTIIAIEKGKSTIVNNRNILEKIEALVLHATTKLKISLNCAKMSTKTQRQINKERMRLKSSKMKRPLTNRLTAKKISLVTTSTLLQSALRPLKRRERMEVARKGITRTLCFRRSIQSIRTSTASLMMSSVMMTKKRKAKLDKSSQSQLMTLSQGSQIA